MPAETEIEQVLRAIEKSTLELARCVRERDPSFADHVHGRAAAVKALEACRLDHAHASQVKRLVQAFRMGIRVEQTVRRWRASIVADLEVVRNQSELARAPRVRTPSGAILDMTI